MKRTVVIWWFGVLVGIVMGAAAGVHAQGYTTEDVLSAIDESSAELGISWTWLYSIVDCETGHTLNPYSVGRQGELGAAQLHPRGELRRFYAWGYLDPFSPYQAVRFLAQRLSMGGARAWSCA